MRYGFKSFILACVLLPILLLGAFPLGAAEAATEESKPKVTLFSIDFCPSCLAAKQHFDDEGIPYQEFNIQDDKQAREAFDRLGGRGTPFIFVDGKTMNGFHPQRFDQLWAEVTGE